MRSGRAWAAKMKGYAMTTISVTPRETANATSDIRNPNAAATTYLAGNEAAVQETFDIEAVGAWVEKEQERLRTQQTESATPVTVENDTIRINEKAMLYDTVYPVKLSDATYHIIFTSDGVIEIYEVAP